MTFLRSEIYRRSYDMAFQPKICRSQNGNCDIELLLLKFKSSRVFTKVIFVAFTWSFEGRAFFYRERCQEFLGHRVIKDEKESVLEYFNLLSFTAF